MARVLPKVEVLRRNVVTKLEAMNEQQLVHVYEWLLQLELDGNAVLIWFNLA